MASTRLLFIFSIIFIMGNAQSFVSLECKNVPDAQYGQESLLECVLKITEDVKNLKIRRVTWKKDGVDEALLDFFEGDTSKQTGYSLAEPSWNNRSKNVSLLISSTTVQHEGIYSCMVFTYAGLVHGKIYLDVTAKYSAPTVTFIPEKTTRNMDGTLVCTSVGGYPKGQLRWFDVDNKEWTSSAEMEAREMKDGRFELSSRLTLLSGSFFSKYTCAVLNATGGKENEFTFDKAMSSPANQDRQKEEEPPTPVSNVVAPVVVIGSLIIGLLLTLIIYRRKRENSLSVPVVSGVVYEREGDPEEKNTLEDNIV